MLVDRRTPETRVEPLNLGQPSVGRLQVGAGRAAEPIAEHGEPGAVAGVQGSPEAIAEQCHEVGEWG